MIQSSVCNFAMNFAMSKTECEKFLLSVKDAIKAEEKAADDHIQITLTEMFDNFKNSQVKLRN